MNPHRPTYILTNFEHKPSSSPIQLGSILAHPLRPTKPLSLPRSAPIPEVVVQSSYSISRTLGKTIKGGIRATFLTLTDVDSTKSGKTVDTTQSFEIDTLETRRLRDEPQGDDAELLVRLQEPKVQAAIDGGLFGKRPVYLISGLKIARGLLARREDGTSTGISIGGTAHIAEGISAGVEAGVESRAGSSSTFRMAPNEEIIFAYQVHRIKLEGRKRDKLTANIFESDSAFLHGDDDGTGTYDMAVAPLRVETWIQEEAEEDSGSETDEDAPVVSCLQLHGGDGEKYLQFQES